MVGGCAVDRPALTPNELVMLRDRTLATMRDEQAENAEKLVRRMHAEMAALAEARARGEEREEPTFDFLVLSGGGDYGAFGAGVLSAWGGVKGELARPEFDVVTGVSTGALIAPFAYLGDDASYAQVERLYREPKDDWVVLKGLLFFWPWSESFASTRGLRRDVEAQLTRADIDRIAEISRTQERALGIGTTNLDLGVMRGFNLGEEAERVKYTGDYGRVYDILMASAAIPGAFPPVEIDGSLYVDGGTTANILFGANLRAQKQLVGLWKATYPGVKPARIRFWVIVNNHLGDVAKVVRPTWPSIAGTSLSTAIRFSTIASLRNLQAQVELLRAVEGFDAEFRYIAIPDEWRPPVEGTFKKETMGALVELGRKLGADVRSWRTELPAE